MLYYSGGTKKIHTKACPVTATVISHKKNTSENLSLHDFLFMPPTTTTSKNDSRHTTHCNCFHRRDMDTTKVYIVLRLLCAEDGSSCDNTDVVLGVFTHYYKALECALHHKIGNQNFTGDDTSPGGEELYSNGYTGNYSERISIFICPVNK
jgi:hypothetical protein